MKPLFQTKEKCSAGWDYFELKWVFFYLKILTNIPDNVNLLECECVWVSSRLK